MYDKSDIIYNFSLFLRNNYHNRHMHKAKEQSENYDVRLVV